VVETHINLSNIVVIPPPGCLQLLALNHDNSAILHWVWALKLGIVRTKLQGLLAEKEDPLLPRQGFVGPVVDVVVVGVPLLASYWAGMRLVEMPIRQARPRHRLLVFQKVSNVSQSASG
jgi:hypothetical protein